MAGCLKTPIVPYLIIVHSCFVLTHATVILCDYFITLSTNIFMLSLSTVQEFYIMFMQL